MRKVLSRSMECLYLRTNSVVALNLASINLPESLDAPKDTQPLDTLSDTVSNTP